MSITVRQWSEEELQSLPKDKWLATVFMNGMTFTEEEIEYYPYKMRRTYRCEWQEEDKEAPGYFFADNVTIYATDERMLLKFIDEEYTRRPDYIHQVITQYRPVKAY